jgi:serpin B
MLTRREALSLVGLATLATAGLPACTDDSADNKDTAPAGLALVASDADRSAGLADAVPDTVASLHAFGGDVYGALPREGNVALSPYSIAVALGMTLNGAVGTTADEMRKVLHVDDTERFNGGLNALTTAVEGLAGTTKGADGKDVEIALDAANALFGERTTPWSDPFLDVLAREYGAGMNTVDFLNAAAQAQDLINGWVAERTHDKIPKLIPPGVITAATRLVLVNALYLKAPWATPFQDALTQMRPFHGPTGRAAEVDMMRATLEGAAYGTGGYPGGGWQAVRIPYAGSTLAMTVVLADNGRQRLALDEAVAKGGLVDVLGSMQPTTVDLQLPKWTFRSPTILNEVLKGLGMKAAFENADFSAMTDNDIALFIAAVVHEVFIAVDEKGTEAAAATAVIMDESAAQVAPVSVVVDRPFLFVIHDVEHGTPLFLGRVDDPTA